MTQSQTRLESLGRMSHFLSFGECDAHGCNSLSLQQFWCPIRLSHWVIAAEMNARGPVAN